LASSTLARPAARRRLPTAPSPALWAASAVALVCALPLLYVLVRAAGAGADTWSSLLDRRIGVLLAHTLGLAAVVCAGTIVLGGGLAWLTVRTDLPGRRVLAPLCALPLAIPPYVGAVIYADVLGPRGGFQQALEPLGVDRLPSIFGFAGAALVLTIFTFPYVYLLVSAGLAGLNPHFDEAARALGSSSLRLAATTARLMLPQLAGGTLLVALYVLSDFGAVSLMRFDTFTTVIYQELGGRFDPPGAAALSSVLVVLTLVFLFAGVKIRGGGRYTQTGGGYSRRSVRELGSKRWPAFAAVVAVLALALGLPLVRLVTWTVQTVAEQNGGELAGWAWNSLVVSGLGATLAVVAALPVAFAVARGGRSGITIGALAQSGYALPGVIVALAAVAVSTRYVGPLYGTLTLLVIAFVVRFLPQAVQAQETGLAQIGGNLTEAARSLGATPRGAFRRVTLPLLRPSMQAAWIVVFLTAVKELPATLVLRPIGFDTLPVRVWTPARDGLYAEAGPAALLLVLLSLIPLVVVLLRRRGAGTTLLA
jgi:iron(III) transport system permease protein